MEHNNAPVERAQIVATIGPACNDETILQQMMQAGMDVARLNFSWGTHDEHARYIAMIRSVAKALGKRIPILQDLSGPRMKTEEGHALDPSAAKVITEKDLNDLAFGIEHQLDYVVLSYVGSADDIRELRREIVNRHGTIAVIAKIERREGVDNIDSIIEVADAVMIGRGDLGLNIPLEEVPFAQKLIINKMNMAKKPVITATQMLLSMTEHLEPTRAEVSDVANAILDGTDAVMLSEETARGQHPIEAVAMMARIITDAEQHLVRTKTLL